MTTRTKSSSEVDVAPPRWSADEVVRLVDACHARLGRPLSGADLEDARQETLIEVWRSAYRIRHAGRHSSWVYSIARHTILSQLRSRRRWGDRATTLVLERDDRPDVQRGPATAADTAFARLVREGIGEEGTTVEAIIEARDVDGESFSRIADAVGLSEAATKGRYYRSVRAIRHRLGRLFTTR